jgi:hypothetical protein
MNDNFCRMVADALTEQDAKEERRKLRPWVGAVVSGMCLALLFVATKSVYGAEVPAHVWSDGKTTINLMPGPCVEPVVKSFLESVGELPKFKAIESSWTYKDGKKMNHGGCWAEFTAKEAGAPEAVFLLLFDDGDKHVVLKSEFLKKRGTLGV